MEPAKSSWGDMGHSVYGYGRLGDWMETPQILEVLCPKIRQQRQNFSAQEVSNALHGFRWINDSQKARPVVAAFLPRLEERM